MIVYKIVKRLKNGKLVSVTAKGSLKTEYEPLKQVEQSNMFAFDTKITADTFLMQLQGSYDATYQLWECDTPMMKIAPLYIPPPFDVRHMKRFWLGDTNYDTMKTPEGAVLCDKITLLKEVTF